VQSFLLDNLLPVTIGNVIGGALMVGVVYWLVYLRPRSEAEASS
jgi:formate transporter